MRRCRPGVGTWQKWPKVPLAGEPTVARLLCLGRAPASLCAAGKVPPRQVLRPRVQFVHASRPSPSARALLLSASLEALHGFLQLRRPLFGRSDEILVRPCSPVDLCVVRRARSPAAPGLRMPSRSAFRRPRTTPGVWVEVDAMLDTLTLLFAEQDWEPHG